MEQLAWWICGLVLWWSMTMRNDTFTGNHASSEKRVTHIYMWMACTWASPTLHTSTTSYCTAQICGMAMAMAICMQQQVSACSARMSEPIRQVYTHQSKFNEQTDLIQGIGPCATFSIFFPWLHCIQTQRELVLHIAQCLVGARCHANQLLAHPEDVHVMMQDPTKLQAQIWQACQHCSIDLHSVFFTFARWLGIKTEVWYARNMIVSLSPPPIQETDRCMWSCKTLFCTLE